MVIRSAIHAAWRLAVERHEFPFWVREDDRLSLVWQGLHLRRQLALAFLAPFCFLVDTLAALDHARRLDAGKLVPCGFVRSSELLSLRDLRRYCGFFRIKAISDRLLVNADSPADLSVADLRLKRLDARRDALAFLNRRTQLVELDAVHEPVDIGECAAARPSITFQQPFEMSACAGNRVARVVHALDQLASLCFAAILLTLPRGLALCLVRGRLLLFGALGKVEAQLARRRAQLLRLSS